MQRTGFTRIGYLWNLRDYPQLIKEKAGIPYYDFNTLNAYVNAQWDDRYNCVLCFAADGTPVDSRSSNISVMLVDTDFTAAGSVDKLYARFTRNRDSAPGSLDDGIWQGVDIGTLAEFTAQFSAAPQADDTAALDSFTKIFPAYYETLAAKLSEYHAKPFDAESAKEFLQNAYRQAAAEGRVSSAGRGVKEIAAFPLGCCHAESGEQLYIRAGKNTRPDARQPWFGAFLVSESELKDELLDLTHFHVGSFLFDNVGDANVFLDKLAEKAAHEDWTWRDPARRAAEKYTKPILKSYLEFTYYRLCDEDAAADEAHQKIVHYAGKAYFNSGLLDHNFRQILIVGDERTVSMQFDAIGECSWQMLENLQAYAENERGVAGMFRKDELPAIATYFSDYREVVFDARLPIHLNDNHIFEDGVSRGRMPKYQAEYEAVKDNEQEKELLLGRIARDFDSAVDRASLMAERNYKLAVPQFRKNENGTTDIQFLLPIYLGEREEAEKPHCALCLALDQSGRVPYYRGVTIFTLDMAYNNARLIAKPDVFWLNDLV
ncbi:MAG: DUF3825 domain-containing protein [Oscillospiraceae bacterium]|nr:DUF3825 domain-containing protein [Oscillospiraceae bacterium]